MCDDYDGKCCGNCDTCNFDCATAGEPETSDNDDYVDYFEFYGDE